MAEVDMGNPSMKSISGDVKDDEVALYTRDANQMNMAGIVIARLSKWEISSLGSGLDTGPDEGTEKLHI